MSSQAHIIVFGNEKGGSGKSTTAMHAAIGLLRLGYNVATIDLDARQGTLTRYLANRFEFIGREHDDLPSPMHFPIEQSKEDRAVDSEIADRSFFISALDELHSHVDFIIIDTPGADTYLSQLAHAHADTIVTPLNDSFIDLDVLARIDAATRMVKAPAIYTKLVQNSRLAKLAAEDKEIDWIVMRNRLSHVEAENKKEIEALLETMAEKFDFRLAPGFTENLIFRELFPKGLTLLDLKQDPEAKLTMAAMAARQEIRQLLRFIAPEQHKGYPHQNISKN